jgi:hypothetical protein
LPLEPPHLPVELENQQVLIAFDSGRDRSWVAMASTALHLDDGKPAADSYLGGTDLERANQGDLFTVPMSWSRLNRMLLFLAAAVLCSHQLCSVSVVTY